MARAILLLSGGLDSTLAGKLLLNLGVTVEAVNYISPFCRCTPKSMGCSAGQRAAEQLGIPIHVYSVGDDYLEIVKQPRFGRGKRMNPCLDCRVFMFSRARRLMKELAADFIATGEVLGERPMSQRRDAMLFIEHESGLDGLILRPLSAKLFPPSRPEIEGQVDRSRLLALCGRKRNPQFELAANLGITEYLCPGGGCLLTDPCFSSRLEELFVAEPKCSLHEVNLLSYGRHFRLESGSKVIVGRNERENMVLESMARSGDVLVKPESVPGPTALCIGDSTEACIVFAARAVAFYIRGGIRVDRMQIEHVGRKSGRDALSDVLPLYSGDLKRVHIIWEKARHIRGEEAANVP